MTAVVLTSWAAKAFILWLALVVGALVWIVTAELADWVGDRMERRYERRLAELHADRLANDPEFVAQVQEIDRQITAGEWDPGPGLDVDELRRRYLPSGDET